MTLSSFLGLRPSVSTSRALRVLSVALLSLFLAACSVVQIAYNQSERLAYWQLNKAFDFDAMQATRVRASLKQFIQWHRRTQLPVYADFAARAQKEALGSVSPELACERRIELERWGRVAVDQAVPMMADVVLSLSPKQIKHLEQYQAKLLDDLKDDYLDGDADDRNKAATKFVLKWSEIFYGRLDSEQRAALQKDIAALPLNAQNVYDEVAINQSEFLSVIRKLQAEHATQPQAEQALRALFKEFFDPSREPMRSQRTQWIASGCKVMSNMHERTTPDQREKAAQRLRDWEHDFRLLSKQPS